MTKFMEMENELIDDECEDDYESPNAVSQAFADLYEVVVEWAGNILEEAPSVPSVDSNRDSSLQRAVAVATIQETILAMRYLNFWRWMCAGQFICSSPSS